MLADLRIRYAVTEAAVVRVQSHDAAQRLPEGGDGWRHIVAYPVRHCPRHGAAQYRRGGKIDSMIVWQEHRTQFDHIRCGAVTEACNWWQRFKSGNFSKS